MYVFYSGKNACSFSHTLIPNKMYMKLCRNNMSYAFFGCVSSYWRTFFICKKLAEVKQLLPEANQKLCIPLIGRVNFTQSARKTVAKHYNQMSKASTHQGLTLLLCRGFSIFLFQPQYEFKQSFHAQSSFISQFAFFY